MIKRILVAGGAGFLGSHLCTRLLKDKHDIICLDNFFTSQKSNITHLLDYPNFELIRHDIINPISLEIDEIYNLACPAAPGHYQHNPVQTMRTSVEGSINLLNLAEHCGARILQASTSEIYGNPTIHPQPETYTGNVNTLGPRACYDEGKRAVETLFMDYHRSKNVDIRIARIFNTYGPYMHPYDGRVISNFIRQALRGEDLTIYGSGSHTRSFCYCDDIVAGLILLMDSNNIGPINLGNPEEHTISDIATLIWTLTDSKSAIVHKGLPEDDPIRRCPDISKAKSKLGWKPAITLKVGLTRTIEWFSGINIDNFRPPTPNYGK